jgi:hypothetical protein
MAPDRRESTEKAIADVLLELWDPLTVHAQPGVHDEYAPFVHELYVLLARGASDPQLTRHLHAIERDGLHHPDADARDVTPVVRALREIEAKLTL